MKYISTEKTVSHFSEIELSPNSVLGLERLNITTPTEIQSATLSPAFNGEDLIAIGSTGTGKTLIFALAVITRLEKDPKARALVLSPSREVADQIFKVFEHFLKDSNIKSCLVISGQNDKLQTSQLRKQPQLIVATPGRLQEHLNNNKLLLQGTQILVIDEVDRMLDSGFGAQLEKIKSTLRGDRQTMMFGATKTKETLRFAEGFFQKDANLIEKSGITPPSALLKQDFLYLEYAEKKEQLVKICKSQEGKIIVFVNDQPNVSMIHKFLLENNVKADGIHGEFKAGHRERVIRDFRESKFKVLIATDLIARGLDIPDIAVVINFDLPFEVEEYLHRVGRTARAGKTGIAISFVSSAQESYVKDFMNLK